MFKLHLCILYNLACIIVNAVYSNELSSYISSIQLNNINFRIKDKYIRISVIVFRCIKRGKYSNQDDGLLNHYLQVIEKYFSTFHIFDDNIYYIHSYL